MRRIFYTEGKIPETVLLWLVVFFLGKETTAQNYIPYYELANKGEYLYFKERFGEALQCYVKAFRLEKPLGKDLYLAALCQAQLKDTSNIMSYLKMACFSDRVSPVVQIKRDRKIFLNAYSNKGIDSLISVLSVFTKCRQEIDDANSYYAVVADTVKYFTEEDQRYRSLQHANLSGSALDSVRMRHDSLLHAEFISYVEVHGFPRGGDMLSSLLTHMHISQYRKAKEILFREVQHGRLLPFYYGLMVDRLDRYYYGETCNLGIYDGSDDCEDSQKKNIIQNRLNIGMSIYFEGPLRSIYEPKTISKLPNNE